MIFWRLTTNPSALAPTLSGHYDFLLVFISVLIATLAGFAALSVLDRILAADSNQKRWTWLIVGSLAMGSGVWSMHFTGMLAFRLPIPVRYELITTLISAVPAILGGAAALYTMAAPSVGWKRLQVGSFFMAACIGTMHYTGMEAMRMPALLRYDLSLFLVSLVVAHLLSTIALYIKSTVPATPNRIPFTKQLLASFFIGLAVSSLHYTAMGAAVFHPVENPRPFGGLYFSPTGMDITISLVSGGIMISAILAARINWMLQSTYRERLQAQRRLDLALEGADAAVWEYDPDRGTTFCDENMYELLGLDQESETIPAEKFMSRIHPEDREEVRETLRTSLETGRPFQVEYRVQKNGEIRWMNGRAQIIDVEGRSAPKVVGVTMDVTDQKQTELALQKSQNRFEQIANNIESVFWLSTVDKTMLYVSPAFADIWGIPPEDLYGDLENFFDRIHPEDRERVRHAVFHKQAGGDYDEEYRIVRPDGEVRWIHDQVFPIEDDEGEVYRLAGLAEDITDQKQLQHELERSVDEQVTLNQEVHHRVKNNLQTIISLIHLQIRDMDTITDDTKSAFQNIENRIFSMALIHDRVYHQNSLTSIDAREYLEELADHIVTSQSPPTLSISLETNIEPVELSLDTLLPCGIVTNELLTNALQHGFPDRTRGTVQLVFEHHQDNRYEFIVRDDGEGWQGNQSFEDTSSLGIRLVKNLVRQQLNGRISLRERSKGLEFQIVLEDRTA